MSIPLQNFNHDKFIKHCLRHRHPDSLTIIPNNEKTIFVFSDSLQLLGSQFPQDVPHVRQMDGVALPKRYVFSRVMADGVFGGASWTPKSTLPPIHRCLRRGGRGGGGRGKRDVATDEDAHAVDFEERLLSLLRNR